MAKRSRKCYRLRYYIKVFFTHLFSHVGLCGLVVGYSVIGAFLFESLEGQAMEEVTRPALPRDKRREIDDFRAKCLEDLWAINVNQSILPVLRKPNWTELTLPRLQQLEESIIGVVTAQRSNGRVEVVEWSFSSALLYSVTVITTIGYGHITPRTDGGKIMTIFYALVGVPLMLLCLTNIGQLMANTFRFTYWSCTVIWRPRRPQATRTSVRYSQKRLSAASAPPTTPAPDAGGGRAHTVTEAVRMPNPPGGRVVAAGELGASARNLLNDVGGGARSQLNGPAGVVRGQSNGPGSSVRSVWAEPGGGEPDGRAANAAGAEMRRGSGPATPIKLLDKETRDILVECAEYVLTEELSSLLETAPQRRGVFRDLAGATPVATAPVATAPVATAPAAASAGGGEGSGGGDVGGSGDGDAAGGVGSVAGASGGCADGEDSGEVTAGGDARPAPSSKAPNAAANHVTFSTPAASERRHPPTPPCRKSSLAARPRSGRSSTGSSGRDSPQRLPAFPIDEPPAAPTPAPASASPLAAGRADRRSDASPARCVSVAFDSDSQSLGPATPRRKMSSPARRAAVNIEHPHLRKVTRDEKRLRRLATRQCSELSGASTLLSTPSSLDSGVYSATQRFTFPEPAPAFQPVSDDVVEVEVVKASGQRAGRVPIPLVLGFVTMYICLGAGIFAWWEEWPFLDGAYFCFITLSTIGFGDLVPGTKVLKAETQEDQLKLVFCCLYLILGLAIIAMSFSLVQEEVIVKCKEVGKCTGILYDSDAEDD